MKAFNLSLILLVLNVGMSLAQTGNPTTLKERASRLKTFFDQHEIEKAYLHFDKPYYAAGDTIYFKAYVLAGEKNALSPLSGVLYADLISPENKVAKAIKLQVIDGLAWGDIALPDSLPGGNYRIRAYTKFMQNYGSELFFDKVITVGAIIKAPVAKAAKTTTVAATQPDMQFFPEGGEMVPGIPAKIAFKALRADGTGIAASGIVLDGAGTMVAKFTASHLGMGEFAFTPFKGKSYRAQTTFADGTKSIIALPAAESTAVAMSVSNLPAKLAIVINAGDGFFHKNKNQPLTLLFYSGGKLTSFTEKLTNREMSFDLMSSRLQPGITQITLLAADGAPLSERLVFIDREDKAALGIATDKKVYKQREQIKVSLHINAADLKAAPAHFSVAVIDKSKVGINQNKEENILTYLLLTSCLKGYIEEPGYYFTNIDNKKREDLDLVMLTHGYRRFSWKNVIDNDLPPITIQPEKALTISGQATLIGGTPLNNRLITLIATKGGSLLTENTNEAGAFSFQNLAFYDSTRFVLNALNNKGNDNTMLTYKPEQLAAVSPALYTSLDTSNTVIISQYLQNSQKQHAEYLKYFGNGIQLKQVNIRGVKQAGYRTQSLAGAGHADAVIKGSDLMSGGMLATALGGRVGGLFFTNADQADGGIPQLRMSGHPMLVVVNGVLRNGSEDQPAGINDISPGDVETIEVLKYSSAAIYGMMSAGGVLIITTKRGEGVDKKNVKSRGILPLAVQGYHKAREFYAPRYDYVNDRTRPDFRSTIYWLPEITTDNNGDASFDFYNADGTGQYQIIVEGINNNGTAGAAKLIYEVKE
jgi:TonB-dependent SusC/RagA subfamily outer membrane receptor